MHKLRHLSKECLLLCLMFAYGHSYSQSMSCSMVNGKTVCESQKSDGNTAGAFSGAFYGQNGAYQDAAVVTGNTQTGDSRSSRTALGNPLPRTHGFVPGTAAFVGTVPFGGHRMPNFHQNYGGWNDNLNGIAGAGVREATRTVFIGPSGSASINRNGFGNSNGMPRPAHGGFGGNAGGSTGINANVFGGSGNSHGIPHPALGGFALPNFRGNTGVNTNGFADTSNGNGIPPPAHGGFPAPNFGAGSTGVITNGFSGASNNHRIPQSTFGGFGVPNFDGNGAHGAGNGYNGYLPGNNPAAHVNDVFGSVGLSPAFPFHPFGKRR